MTYFRENIEKTAGYVPGFQPKGDDIVKLNTNENPYPPSPKVMEAIAAIGGEELRRYPDPKALAFRQAASEVLNVPEDCIMPTNGGDELLTIAFRAFCDEDRSVAYPEPTYSLYPVLANLQGCAVQSFAFDDEYGLPAELSKTGAALTIVCNPNAPSGTFVGQGRLAELAGELAGALLVDEAYVDFADEDCIQLVRDFANVIILRSMSKGYSLAGIRFGYAAAQPRLIEGLMKVRDSYNTDAVAIAAATAAIKDQEYFRQNVEKVKAERARMVKELSGLGLSVCESRTNFLLARCESRPADRVYEKLAQRNIYVRYFPLPRLEDKLRITIGTAEQNDTLIAALKEILEK